MKKFIIGKRNNEIYNLEINDFIELFLIIKGVK
jgi:hypothetical protein